MAYDGVTLSQCTCARPQRAPVSRVRESLAEIGYSLTVSSVSTAISNKLGLQSRRLFSDIRLALNYRR
jgi:hypothetical protein